MRGRREGEEKEEEEKEEERKGGREGGGRSLDIGMAIESVCTTDRLEVTNITNHCRPNTLVGQTNSLSVAFSRNFYRPFVP